MARLLSVVVMAGVVLIAGTALMSTAFTAAEIDRTAEFKVDADGASVVQLDPGPGDGASYDAEGQLQLTLTKLNKNANFTFGDITDPSNTDVFTITNNDGTEHNYELGAAGLGTGVQFYVEDPDNTTFSGFPTFTGTGNVSFNLGDTETAYVAIDVSDTGNTNFTSGTVYVNASSGPTPVNP